MSTTFKVEGGDVAINRGTGQPAMVSGRDKLRQDLRNGLAMETRRDNIGAGLEDLVRGQAATASFIERSLRRNIRAMVSAIQDLQTRYQRPERPRSEILVRLASLEVQQVAADPTSFYFRVTFASGDAGANTLVGRVN